MSVNAPAANPLDIALPLTPEQVDDPKAFQEFTIVYRALRSLQVAIAASVTLNTPAAPYILDNIFAKLIGLRVSEVANGKQGIATLVAGTVTISNTSITANSRIFCFPQEAGLLIGDIRVSARVVGASFTITSTVATDTATFAYEIFEPA